MLSRKINTLTQKLIIIPNILVSIFNAMLYVHSVYFGSIVDEVEMLFIEQSYIAKRILVIILLIIMSLSHTETIYYYFALSVIWARVQCAKFYRKISKL